MAIFNTPKEERKVQENISTIANIIGKGTHITGDIETLGNIRIDGSIKGNIKCKQKLATGQGSFLEGNIYAQNAEIEGEIKGTLEISEVLILKATAVVTGEIYTAKLVIENGAKFNGTCKMGESNKTPKIEDGLKQTTKTA
ncbi:MAG: polymer-forming cytoskeletal protein [Cytophagales bacterium]|nr:polymer-forming cytoskeletal protein [Bernardetiaceae bacterium]MDW8204586.1 polymer-forming cytoskeletal protein [Cytophagales bacterium]